VHDIILDERQMKVHEIAETIGISKERVGYILHEELDMKKLCARWVPRLLTAHQKRTHMKNL
jgi:plasmid maintenance system antidote protein VapI